MTDKTTRMRALTTIEGGSGEMIATGEVDADGVPIMERKGFTIPRGTIFMADPEMRDQLLRMDGAEVVDE